MLEAPWIGDSYDRYRNNYYGFSGRKYDGIIYVNDDDDDDDEEEEEEDDD